VKCINSEYFQLVLNGNNIPWSAVVSLTNKLTKLDELHISANNLGNPGNFVIEVNLNMFMNEKLVL